MMSSLIYIKPDLFIADHYQLTALVVYSSTSYEEKASEESGAAF